MRTYFDCVPCAIRQVLDSVRMITDDETLHERVLRESLGMWRQMDLRLSPPAIAQKTHQLVRRLTGVADLIIAKGQGNFESFPETAKSVFFLLRPKCVVLSRHLRCEIGRLIVVQNGNGMP